MENQNNESYCCGSSNLWKSIAIILIILVIAGAAYYFGTLKGKPKTDNTTAKQTEVTTPASTSTTSTNTTGATQSSADKYPGWSTLTDTKMGYTLRFPTTWTAKIEDGEMDKNHPAYGSFKWYHYLILMPSDKSHTLLIGIAEKNSAINIYGDRTGIGVGENKAAGTIKVAGIDMQVIDYVYNSDIQEVLYNYRVQNPKLINGDYEFIANLMPSVAPYKISANDPEYVEAKKILESIEFVKK